MELFSLKFEGLDADDGRLDLYDASISNHGFARTLAILGHYYATGKIISQAPRSDIQIYVYAAEAGSFKQVIAAAAVSGMISAPFGVFMSRIIDSWVPAPIPQMERVIELLQEQNRLKRIELGLPEVQTSIEQQQQNEVDEFLKQQDQEIQVLRSITANSFKDIFRPVGRSAEYVSLLGGNSDQPITAIDPIAVSRIESERRDPKEQEIVGVVNSFSRSSKTGIIFSQEVGRGFQFQDINEGKLPPQDDYSWSQYTRLPLEMTGNYVYWYDGRVKRFLVQRTRRIE